ncbi:Rib/alpha-like domain-containing protein [Aerococcus tenax]|uniref:Rib/alpha-like domain-containing protein n=3 Tax=Bacteria TaxID=2 RepID=UPI0011BF29F3|nr:Rib/alpha-like domain-containing protein [Aerococcus tenax]WIW74479.2 Rib/alpha-like domain-containing protein [Aerococcus tenax]
MKYKGFHETADGDQVIDMMYTHTPRSAYAWNRLNLRISDDLQKRIDWTKSYYEDRNGEVYRFTNGSQANNKILVMNNIETGTETKRSPIRLYLRDNVTREELDNIDTTIQARLLDANGNVYTKFMGDTADSNMKLTGYGAYTQSVTIPKTTSTNLKTGLNPYLQVISSVDQAPDFVSSQNTVSYNPSENKLYVASQFHKKDTNNRNENLNGQSIAYRLAFDKELLDVLKEDEFGYIGYVEPSITSGMKGAVNPNDVRTGFTRRQVNVVGDMAYVIYAPEEFETNDEIGQIVYTNKGTQGFIDNVSTELSGQQFTLTTLNIDSDNLKKLYPTINNQQPEMTAISVHTGMIIENDHGIDRVKMTTNQDVVARQGDKIEIRFARPTNQGVKRSDLVNGEILYWADSASKLAMKAGEAPIIGHLGVYPASRGARGSDARYDFDVNANNTVYTYTLPHDFKLAAGSDISLYTGANGKLVDNSGEVYINGVKVAEFGQGQAETSYAPRLIIGTEVNSSALLDRTQYMPVVKDMYDFDKVITGYTYVPNQLVEISYIDANSGQTRYVRTMSGNTAEPGATYTVEGGKTYPEAGKGLYKFEYAIPDTDRVVKDSPIVARSFNYQTAKDAEERALSEDEEAIQTSVGSDAVIARVLIQVTYDLNNPNGTSARRVMTYAAPVETNDAAGNTTAIENSDVPRNEDFSNEVGYTNNGLEGNMANDPTLEGYRFLGWNTAQDGSGNYITPETAFQNSTTVYAQWQKVTMAEEFEPGYDNVSVEEGQADTVAAPTFIKNGQVAHPEVSQFTTSEAGVTVNADGSITIPASFTEGKAGQTVQIPVTITYADNTTDTVDVYVDITRKPENELYDPTVNPVEKDYGQSPTEDEIKKAITVPGYQENPAHPGQTPTVTIDNPNALPDGKTPGVHEVPVTVTYPDGTTDPATVTVTVKEQPEKDKYTPEVTPINKDYGQETTEDEIKNAVTVPSYQENPSYPGQTPTVTVDDPNALPDGNTPGEHKVPVTVTYPDGTQDQTEVTVTVKPQPEKDKYQPEVQPVEKDYGQATTEDEIKGAVTVPGYHENPSYPGKTPTVTIDDPATLPDGNTPGVHEVPITVTYPDGTTDPATVTVTVKPQPENDKYTPEVTPIEKDYGQSPTEEEIKNSVTVPNYPTTGENGEALPQPTVTVDNPNALPDGKTPGVHEVPVTVEYPDGTTDPVTVKVVVNKSNEDTYQPSYPQPTVTAGESTATELTPNFTANVPNDPNDPTGPSHQEQGVTPPAGTKFSINVGTGGTGFNTADGDKATIDPDTGLISFTPGTNHPTETQVNIPVKVTYPDGTVDEVTATVTVKPQPENDKYDPSVAPVEKEYGDPTTTADIEKAVTVPGYEENPAYPGQTPNVTVDNPSALPDGKTPGNYTVPVTVEYPDGTKDQADVTVTVKMKDKAVYDTAYPAVNHAESGQGSITIKPTIFTEAEIQDPAYPNDPLKTITTKKAMSDVPTGTTFAFQDPNTAGVTTTEVTLDNGDTASINPITGEITYTPAAGHKEDSVQSLPAVVTNYPTGQVDHDNVTVNVEKDNDSLSESTQNAVSESAHSLSVAMSQAASASAYSTSAAASESAHSASVAASQSAHSASVATSEAVSQVASTSAAASESEHSLSEAMSQAASASAYSTSVAASESAHSASVAASQSAHSASVATSEAVSQVASTSVAMSQAASESAHSTSVAASQSAHSASVATSEAVSQVASTSVAASESTHSASVAASNSANSLSEAMSQAASESAHSASVAASQSAHSASVATSEAVSQVASTSVAASESAHSLSEAMSLAASASAYSASAAASESAHSASVAASNSANSLSEAMSQAASESAHSASEAASQSAHSASVATSEALSQVASTSAAASESTHSASVAASQSAHSASVATSEAVSQAASTSEAAHDASVAASNSANSLSVAMSQAASTSAYSTSVANSESAHSASVAASQSAHSASVATSEAVSQVASTSLAMSQAASESAHSASVAASQSAHSASLATSEAVSQVASTSVAMSQAASESAHSASVAASQSAHSASVATSEAVSQAASTSVAASESAHSLSEAMSQAASASAYSASVAASQSAHSASVATSEAVSQVTSTSVAMSQAASESAHSTSVAASQSAYSASVATSEAASESAHSLSVAMSQAASASAYSTSVANSESAHSASVAASQSAHSASVATSEAVSQVASTSVAASESAHSASVAASQSAHSASVATSEAVSQVASTSVAMSQAASASAYSTSVAHSQSAHSASVATSEAVSQAASTSEAAHDASVAASESAHSASVAASQSAHSASVATSEAVSQAVSTSVAASESAHSLSEAMSQAASASAYSTSVANSQSAYSASTAASESAHSASVATSEAVSQVTSTSVAMSQAASESAHSTSVVASQSAHSASVATSEAVSQVASTSVAMSQAASASAYSTSVANSESAHSASVAASQSAHSASIATSEAVSQAASTSVAMSQAASESANSLSVAMSQAASESAHSASVAASESAHSASVAISEAVSQVASTSVAMSQAASESAHSASVATSEAVSQVASTSLAMSQAASESAHSASVAASNSANSLSVAMSQAASASAYSTSVANSQSAYSASTVASESAHSASVAASQSAHSASVATSEAVSQVTSTSVAMSQAASASAYSTSVANSQSAYSASTAASESAHSASVATSEAISQVASTSVATSQAASELAHSTSQVASQSAHSLSEAMSQAASASAYSTSVAHSESTHSLSVAMSEIISEHVSLSELDSRSDSQFASQLASTSIEQSATISEQNSVIASLLSETQSQAPTSEVDSSSEVHSHGPGWIESELPEFDIESFSASLSASESESLEASISASQSESASISLSQAVSTSESISLSESASISASQSASQALVAPDSGSDSYTGSETSTVSEATSSEVASTSDESSESAGVIAPTIIDSSHSGSAIDHVDSASASSSDSQSDQTSLIANDERRPDRQTAVAEPSAHRQQLVATNQVLPKTGAVSPLLTPGLLFVFAGLGIVSKKRKEK